MTVRSSVGRRLAGALALTVLALSGCTAESGAAAVVEGEPIPVADVHAATDQLRPYLTDITPASVLVVLIAEPTFQRAAEDNGFGVSTGQVQDLLDQLASGGEGPAPQFGDAARTVARFTLLQQGLQGLPEGQQVIRDAVADLDGLDVDVNPRYGELDFAAGGITPVVHPWLVADDAPAP